MIGNRHIRLDVVDSTNRYARDLVREGPPEGTVITAQSQTAGRGRLDRQWLSAGAQNILASIILYPTRPMEEWGGLPLLTGLAVCRAVRRVSPIEPDLKWPNDILVGNRKLCGILVESGRIGEKSWVVVGIGLNVNQVRFDGSYRTEPTSLAREAGRPFATDDVLSAVCREMNELYSLWKGKGNAPVMTAWKSASSMFGKNVIADENGRRTEGIAVDLGEDGSLCIKLSDGSIRYFLAGDVSIRKES